MWRTVRRVLRWVTRIGLAVLGLAIVALGAALIIVHTDWGRELVRKRVELVLRDVLPGGARIGKIEGSVFGTLIVHDIEVDTLAHRPLVVVGSVQVEVAILPLIGKTVRVESIVVDDVHVDPAAGPLLPPRPDEPDEPLKWRIELPHIELHRGALALAGIDPVRELELAAAVTVAGRDITAYAWLGAAWGDKRVDAAASVAIDSHGVRVPAALVTLEAKGGRARVGVTDLLIDRTAPPSGAAAGRGQAPTIDALRPRGVVLVSAPAPVVDEWFPAARQIAALGTPLGDAVVQLVLSDEPGGATRIALTGRTGVADLEATLHASIAKLTAHGVIALTGLALSPLTHGSLTGPGAVLVAVDASLAHATAKLAVLPALVPQPEPRALAALDRMDQALVLSETSVARASVALGAIGAALAGPTAPASPRVFATAELRKQGATWSLSSSRVAGTLAGVSAGGQPVRGSLAFHVQARPHHDPAPHHEPTQQVAPAPDPHAPAFVIDADVRGGLELRGGGFRAISVARAGAGFEGRITGNKLDVRGVVTADQIASAGAPIGNVRVAAGYRTGQPILVEVSARPAAVPLAADLSARVTLGDVIRVALPRLELALPDGKRWTGGGGTVEISDRIVLRGLGLRNAEAALDVSGQLDKATQDFSAKITATHIALAALNPKLRGEGGSVISVERRHQRWRADATLDLTGFAAGKSTPPTDASIHVALGGDQLTVDVRAHSPDAGAVELTIAAAAPRDPTDVAAWRRLDSRAIHTAKLAAHQLQIGGLVERAASPADLADDDELPHHVSPGAVPLAVVAPPPPPSGDPDDAPSAGDPSDSEPLRGTIDGEIDLAPSNPGGSLAIRGVGTPVGVLDGDVALAPHDGQLAIKLDARMPDIAVAHVAVELGVPVHPFDAATWRDGGRSLLREVDASVDKVRINAAMLEKLGIAKKLAARGIVLPYRASVAATAHLGAGASDAKLNLDVTGIRGGLLVQSVSQHFELTADRTGTVFHGELRGGGVKKGDEGTVPLGTLDATLAMTMAQWLATPRAVLGAALSARWTLAETDAIPVLAIFGRRELIGGTLAIDAEVHGTPHAPVIDHAEIVARKLAVAPQLGGRPPPMFDELGVSARLAGGVASVTVTGRESGGGTLDAKLDAPLGADLIDAATGSLTAHQVDLAPIAAVLPGRFSAAAGTLDGTLGLRGGKISGALAITGGALPIAPMIGTLHDASAKLSIDDKTVHVELTGGLGGGAIQLTADAPPDVTTATATLSLTKVALLGSRRTELSAEIGAKLKLGGGQIHGDLDLTRTRIRVAQRSGVALLDVSAPDDLELPGIATRTVIGAAPPIAKPVAAPPPGAPAEAAPPRAPVISLHVALGSTSLSAPDAVQLIPGVDVATVHAVAHSDAGLDVSIGDTVSIVGRIDLDNGDVDFLGRRYLITPVVSAVTFDGSVDPLLAIQMSYAFPSMTLTADVRGRVSAPDPHLSADIVGYSDDQLFAFFLGGAPGGDPSSETGEAVTSALTKVASGALGRQVNKILPVKLDSVACAPGTAAASKTCTFGKQLSRRLYLYYSPRPTPLPNENTMDVQLQYRLSNTTLLDVTGGDRGHASADLLSRHPW